MCTKVQSRVIGRLCFIDNCVPPPARGGKAAATSAGQGEAYPALVGVARFAGHYPSPMAMNYAMSSWFHMHQTLLDLD